MNKTNTTLAIAADEVPRNQILLGDALDRLRQLPDNSVDCVITSPPYYLLRNYAVPGQLGEEPSIHGWVDALVKVAREIDRVLRPAGTFWLNLGDSYSRHRRYGAPPKSLLLGPERVLLRLAHDGWIVRNKLVWAKPNPMPASVADRLTCTWEPLYLLTHSGRYHFDLDAIREPHRSTRKPSAFRPQKYGGKHPAWVGALAGANDGLDRARAEGRPGHVLGKNPGDVLNIATAGYRGAHFAVFPEALVRRPLLAGCPERSCTNCDQAWKRVDGQLQPACSCDRPWRPGLVLDPFMGAGTVAVTAKHHGRDWLGIELNPDYRRLALARIAAQASGAKR